ncbi:hypothetical protein DAEQUDRAFT_520754 [Daedalea quercina L-15889]|uniref:NB-ARC domain-containing protein n=1 Tax=Daedalea quercina L-15889 TaxID=1314783 RepID=A0A165MCL3_9APHY|nr:hypothetical protein DAEQUDRAFT_520754 [Daedalea quercina L-15889]
MSPLSFKVLQKRALKKQQHKHDPSASTSGATETSRARDGASEITEGIGRGSLSQKDAIPSLSTSLHSEAGPEAADARRATATPIAGVDSKTPAQLVGPLPTTPSIASEPSGQIDGLPTDVVDTVLSLADSVASAFDQVPYVGAVIGVLRTILEMKNTFDSNGETCQTLITATANAAEPVMHALYRLKSGTEVNKQIEHALHESLKEYKDVFDTVESKLKSYQKLSWFTRGTQGKSLEKWLDELDKVLNRAYQKFTIQVNILNSMTSADILKSVQSPANVRASTSTKPIWSPLPAEPDVHGRDDEKTEIVKSITQSTGPTYAAITGLGGIGKTTLALAVMHHQEVVDSFGERRLFISCETCTSADAVITAIYDDLFPGSRLSNTASNPNETSDAQNTKDLEKAVSGALDDKRTLLCLDNFETPWDIAANRKSIEDMFGRLRGLKELSVMLTMRRKEYPRVNGITWGPRFDLHPVAHEFAVQIFCMNSGNKVHADDDDVGNLIRAVDCIPLAVTILGHLTAEDGESPQALWTRWDAENIGVAESSVGTEDRLHSLGASIRLSIESPRITACPGADTVLLLIAMLPDGLYGDYEEALDREMKKMIPRFALSRALADLRKSSLIVRRSGDTDVHTMLVPIRTWCLENLLGVKAIARDALLSVFSRKLLHGWRHKLSEIPRHRTEVIKGLPNMLVIFNDCDVPLDGELALASAEVTLLSVATKRGSHLTPSAVDLAIKPTGSDATKAKLLLTRGHTFLHLYQYGLARLDREEAIRLGRRDLEEAVQLAKETGQNDTATQALCYLAHLDPRDYWSRCRKDEDAIFFQGIDEIFKHRRAEAEQHIRGLQPPCLSAVCMCSRYYDLCRLQMSHCKPGPVTIISVRLSDLRCAVSYGTAARAHTRDLAGL